MPAIHRKRWLAGVMVAACAATMTCAMPALAAPSVSERLDTLERKVDSRGLIDLLTQVEQLQRDIQQLRGDLEVQNHTLETLQNSQRDMYLDIDRRLRALESGQPGATPPAALSPPATAPGAASVGGPAAPPGAASVAPSVAAPPAGSVPPAAPPRQFDFTSTGGAPVPAGNAGVPAADLEYAPVTGSGAAPASNSNPVDEKAEYDTALAILRDGRYSDAALAFKQFITSHPNGSYTDNALYWLGETYYVTRDFDQSQSTFRDLTTRFPQSPKTADSHLKLGFIYYEKQDWKAARSELETVVNSWPTSTAARLANERLARMKQEKH